MQPTCVVEPDLAHAYGAVWNAASVTTRVATDGIFRTRCSVRGNLGGRIDELGRGLACAGRQHILKSNGHL